MAAGNFQVTRRPCSGTKGFPRGTSGYHVIGGCLLALLGVAALGFASHDPATADAAEASPLDDSLDETPIRPRDREHWSYRPLVRPELPSLPASADVASAIDHFLEAQRFAKHGRPVREASRPVLLRRLTLTLTGIAPTPRQLEDFLADPAPDAYERRVDQLLASPRFGQRWGQYWLDLARFAETDGYEFDTIRPQAWEYRDWVIEAANQDLSYDEFVRLQLAGDELYGNESREARATAFCLSGPDMPDINSQDERRHSLLNELTGTVGAVLMATQIGCAQCHEHRFDPISQADFFRLRAFFESSVRLVKNRSIQVLQTRPEDERLRTHLAIRGDWRRPGPELQPEYPRVVNLRDEPYQPPSDHESNAAGPRTALANWLVHEDHPLTARVIANRVWQFHFGRGLCSTPSDFGLAGDNPSHPELLDYLAVELREGGWSLKKLHRQILLSAAFRQSSYLDEHDLPPGTDRDEVRANWEHNIEVDPSNRWYTRFARRRLEGEWIRDSMLSATGQLDERMGGPGVRPPLPEELRGTLLKGQWDVTEDESEHYRSSVYVFARRNLRYPIFDVFDRPDPNQSCPRRHASTTAPQALLLLNSEFSWRMAEQLARRAWSEVTETAAGTSQDPAEGDAVRREDTLAVGRAMQLAWGRQPRPAEVTEATEFLESRLADKSREGRDRARAQLCLAILNASEFLYID